MLFFFIFKEREREREHAFSCGVKIIKIIANHKNNLTAAFIQMETVVDKCENALGTLIPKAGPGMTKSDGSAVSHLDNFGWWLSFAPTSWLSRKEASS